MQGRQCPNCNIFFKTSTVGDPQLPWTLFHCLSVLTARKCFLVSNLKLLSNSIKSLIALCSKGELLFLFFMAVFEIFEDYYHASPLPSPPPFAFSPPKCGHLSQPFCMCLVFQPLHHFCHLLETEAADKI